MAQSAEERRRSMIESSAVRQKSETLKRLVHEFASYCVAHEKPIEYDSPYITRMIVNAILLDWIRNDFTCGSSDCVYCNVFPESGYKVYLRSALRNLGKRGRDK